ncbi:MAG TPA: DUF1707 domain-containing protein [Longimicrobium sp.]|nr:DUF1707 domain-containing protein [Longimicrobium sp.]
MSDPTLKPVPLEQTRQRIVDQLCAQYAAENLTDELLEQRLGQAFAATSVVELNALVADLPTESAAAPAASTTVAMARPDMVADRQVVVAVMGAAERKGGWTPPRQLNVIAVMGGVELDFREARFAPGLTEVTCFAMMGGIEIIVPPGVHVETNGMGLMGGFAHSGSADVPADPNAPVLRIGGVAIMGGVELDVRFPGEKRGDARRRERLHRAEHRAIRRLKRGG